MAGEMTQGMTRTFKWYDSGANGYPVAKYTPVSLYVSDTTGATVMTPTVGSVLGATINSTRIIGVTLDYAEDGYQVPVQMSGIVQVWANAAITVGATVYVVSTTNSTLTSQSSSLLVAPFKYVGGLIAPKLEYDGAPSQAVCIACVDDATITASSTGANTRLYPLGIALEAATQQYQLIKVLLATQGVYA